jgi:nuclear pore complex protein Nup98-Nup96
VNGNPMHHRLPFHLYHALSTVLPEFRDNEKADVLTWNFAAELEAAGEWIWALFALLHLSDSERRQEALQALLARCAAEIDERDLQRLQILTNDLQIPPAWIWEAKALHSRSVDKNHIKEVEYLLMASNWNEAHQTFCRVVAPRLIIEQNHALLQQIVESFHEEKVSNWETGGQVYRDYVRLVNESDGEDKKEIVKRLLNAIPTIIPKKPAKLDLAENVALHEMSTVVGKVVLEDSTAMNIAMVGVQMDCSCPG